MKKFLIVILLVLVGGCGESYKRRQNELNERGEDTKANEYKAQQDWERLTVEEANFISKLNDEQLVAYQNLSDIYATGEPAAEELARRRLEQCLDVNSYTKALDMMQEKHTIRLRIDTIGKENRTLQEEGKELKKDKSDYKLRQSIWWR